MSARCASCSISSTADPIFKSYDVDVLGSELSRPPRGSETGRSAIEQDVAGGDPHIHAVPGCGGLIHILISATLASHHTTPADDLLFNRMEVP